MSAQKNGRTIPKKEFQLQKNSLLHRWSQLKEVIEVVSNHTPSNADHLACAMAELTQMAITLKSPHLEFLQAQLQMLLTPKNNLRYTKHLLVFAAELLCISPAAYRMLRRSGAINLPREQLIRELMSSSFQDQNLPTIFSDLKPQQRLVNILLMK